MWRGDAAITVPFRLEGSWDQRHAFALKDLQGTIFLTKLWQPVFWEHIQRVWNTKQSINRNRPILETNRFGAFSIFEALPFLPCFEAMHSSGRLNKPGVAFSTQNFWTCVYIAIVLVTCWWQILVVYMVVEDSPLQAFGVPCSTKHFPGLGCTVLHLHPHWRLPKVYARSLCIQKIQAIHIQIGAHKRLWMNHDQVITVTLVDTVIISHIQTKIIMDLWQRLKSMRDVSPTAGSGWLAAPRNAPSCLCSFFWSCRHDLPRRWLEL